MNLRNLGREPVSADLLGTVADVATKTMEDVRSDVFKPGGIKEQISYTTGEVAEAMGKTTSAIRKMHDKRVYKSPVPEPDRGGNNYRRYTQSNLLELMERAVMLPRQIYDTSSGAKRIAFINYKGGCGKSTNAVHFAHFCVKKGLRVLLVDVDPQGSATTYSGWLSDWEISETQTLFDLYTTTRPEDYDLTSKLIKVENWPGLSLLPSNLRMHEAEFNSRDLVKIHPVFTNLDVALKAIEDDYDLIIMDPPPTLGVLSLSVLSAADGIVTPLQPNMMDLTSTVQFVDMIAGYYDRLITRQPKFIRFLLNNVQSVNRNPDGPIRAHDLVTDEIRGAWNSLVLDNMLLHSVEIQSAAYLMRSLYEMTQAAGSRRTQRRALKSANAVYQELYDIIAKTWEGK